MPTTAFSYYCTVNGTGEKEEHLNVKKFETTFVFFKQRSWLKPVINKRSSHYAK